MIREMYMMYILIERVYAFHLDIPLIKRISAHNETQAPKNVGLMFLQGIFKHQQL